MGTPVPPSVVEAFGAGGTEGVDYTIIPVPSQVGVSPELASFTTGFPPATRTPRTSGGIPPRGLDMNGILYMATAHVAWVAAGNAYSFNQDVVDTVGGYNLGAILRSASDPQTFFYSLAADNTNDPDVDPTDWAPFNPIAASATGDQSATPAAGSVVIALDPGVAFLDVEANASGGSTITDITGAVNGQIVTIRNTSATDVLTLQANADILLSADLSLLENDSVTLRFRSSIPAWVAMS